MGEMDPVAALYLLTVVLIAVVTIAALFELGVFLLAWVPSRLADLRAWWQRRRNARAERSWPSEGHGMQRW